MINETRHPSYKSKQVKTYEKWNTTSIIGDMRRRRILAWLGSWLDGG